MKINVTYFYFFNITTGKFLIAYMVYITFLLVSISLNQLSAYYSQFYFIINV